MSVSVSEDPLILLLSDIEQRTVFLLQLTPPKSSEITLKIPDYKMYLKVWCLYFPVQYFRIFQIAQIEVSLLTCWKIAVLVDYLGAQRWIKDFSSTSSLVSTSYRLFCLRVCNHGAIIMLVKGILSDRSYLIFNYHWHATPASRTIKPPPWININRSICL